MSEEKAHCSVVTVSRGGTVSILRNMTRSHVDEIKRRLLWDAVGPGDTARRPQNGDIVQIEIVDPDDRSEGA